MTPDMDDCAYKEPAFSNEFGNGLNSYLKSEQLGKTEASSPRFRSLLAVMKQTMGRKVGPMSDRESIAAAVIDPG